MREKKEGVKKFNGFFLKKMGPKLPTYRKNLQFFYLAFDL
jgi:hypothetical protein